MNFNLKYPNLSQFLSSYFPDADLDGLTDQQVAIEFAKTNPEEIVTVTLEELKKVIDDQSSFEAVGIEANRYFENNQAVLDWLKMIAFEISVTIQDYSNSDE